MPRSTILPTCPLPHSQQENVLLGHGSGGSMSAELLHEIFLPAFSNPQLDALNDQAVLDADGVQLAFTTDTFVVSPLFFPGGDIGQLAVNGTVNDLAMCGAKPIALSGAFILEEGFPLGQLRRIVDSMAVACRAAGVQLVTGDTKVVERGKGDGVFISTSGIGVVRPGSRISADQAQVGDAILISGPIGDHGIAVLSAREGLEFESALQSDTAPLNGLVQSLLETSHAIHCLRDPTRGGVATILCELAASSGVAMLIDETAIPIRPEVHGACELLGLDPLYVACEGKLVAVVAQDGADPFLKRMRAHPLGSQASRIGTVVEGDPGSVVARTAFGTERWVERLSGALLPRIC